MIEKVDLTKAYYLQHLITEHYQECMDEWYKKCKFKKDKEVEMKKVEKYISLPLFSSLHQSFVGAFRSNGSYWIWYFYSLLLIRIVEP